MYSLSLQTVTNSSELTESLLSLLKNLSKLGVILVLIYLGQVKNIRKNGVLTRLQNFNIRAELVNKYPGVRMFPLLGSIPLMSHMVYNPCRVVDDGQFYTNSFMWKASLKDDNFPGRPSEMVEMGRKIEGEGLIMISPDVHGPRKKIWKQWFTRRIVNGSLEIFQKEAIRLSEKLAVETNKTFDIVDYSLHCAFRTIACSAFGEKYVNCISETDAKQHFHGLTTRMLNLFTRSFRPWLANDFIYYKLTAKGRETMRCAEIGHQITNQAIAHGKMLRTKGVRQMDSNGTTPCFLDHLLDILEQGDLTENEVSHEINNFIVAGYDTTGLSMCWTLYLLALHPECQTKIVDELCEIFNGNIKHFSSQVNPRHLQNMKYLELCVKESLRLYPALGMLFRRSANDKVVVMPDGKVIPSGVDMYIPLRIIHKDPKYFPEPEKFIPERHLVSIPAYMPFGLGSRNCIGRVYAMQEMKIMLAYLLMEYKWETLEKPGLEPLMVPMSYPENGIRFKISRRCNI